MQFKSSAAQHAVRNGDMVVILATNTCSVLSQPKRYFVQHNPHSVWYIAMWQHSDSHFKFLFHI